MWMTDGHCNDNTPSDDRGRQEGKKQTYYSTDNFLKFNSNLIIQVTSNFLPSLYFWEQFVIFADMNTNFGHQICIKQNCIFTDLECTTPNSLYLFRTPNIPSFPTYNFSMDVVQSLWMKIRQDEPDLQTNFEDFLSRVTGEIKRTHSDLTTMEAVLRK